MATLTIKRVRIQKPPNVSEDIKQLARDSRLLLKHHHLANRVLASQERLSEVLRRLEINPYDATQVRLYQEEKEQKLRRQRGHEYARWRERAIKDTVEVPLFVLRKAVEIKRACPDVRLFIEALENDPDPFLVAKLGPEKFYIEVWDERDFEDKL